LVWWPCIRCNRVYRAEANDCKLKSVLDLWIQDKKSPMAVSAHLPSSSCWEQLQKEVWQWETFENGKEGDTHIDMMGHSCHLSGLNSQYHGADFSKLFILACIDSRNQTIYL
jgi:hypothetical protein